MAAAHMAKVFVRRTISLFFGCVHHTWLYTWQSWAKGKMREYADRGGVGLGSLRKCCELISCRGPVFYHALSSGHVLWDGHSE